MNNDTHFLKVPFNKGNAGLRVVTCLDLAIHNKLLCTKKNVKQIILKQNIKEHQKVKVSNETISFLSREIIIYLINF